MKFIRLKSFTMLELIIVMILSSLVLMITLLAFQLLNRHYQSYQYESAQLEQLYSFFTTFDRDLQNAVVQRNNNVFTLHKKTRKFIYTFDVDRIIREEEGHTDTLLQNLSNITFEQVRTSRNQIKMILTLSSITDTVQYPFSYNTDTLSSGQ